MSTLALLVAMIALKFSLMVTADIHRKVQDTNLDDHRRQIKMAMVAQAAVIIWLAGLLIYRHVGRLVN